jgi:hypothetical protein
MKIWAIYLAYAWVGLLHAFFIGTCLHAWGRHWVGKHLWFAFAVALGALAFFETYWIPVFGYLVVPYEPFFCQNIYIPILRLFFKVYYAQID